MKTKRIRLYTESLLTDASVIPYINSFKVDKEYAKALETYLKKYAVTEEMNNMARTYLVRDKDTKEIVAYFSLKAGLQTTDAYIDENGNEQIDSLPGVELSNWAVNSAYKKKHDIKSSLGEFILKRIILKKVAKVSKEIGVATFFIYSLPQKKLINWYLENGFSRLPANSEEQLHSRIKPAYDQGCVFMYMPVSTIKKILKK